MFTHRPLSTLDIIGSDNLALLVNPELAATEGKTEIRRVLRMSQPVCHGEHSRNQIDQGHENPTDDEGLQAKDETLRSAKKLKPMISEARTHPQVAQIQANW